jgi:hypothetical protein
MEMKRGRLGTCCDVVGAAFPEELPGMPPDRDIQFVIELKPDTTPIYKTPYRIATLELVELKEHIKELLEKGFIHPSSSPW